MEFDELSNRVIGCASEVHRNLGPALLESARERYLAHELSWNQIAFQLQLALPAQNIDVRPDCGYRVDILIENQRIVKWARVEEVGGIHEAQRLTDMKSAGGQIGWLVKFNVTKRKDSIKRFVL